MRYAISGIFGIRPTRAVWGVILLTSLIILSGCKGGGGDTSAGLTGSSGSLCLTDEYTYRVDIDGQSPVQYGVNPDLLAGAYEGNIGGQIRGIAEMNIAAPGEEPQVMLLWGAGASVRYGTHEVEAGEILLKKPGAVMDIVPISYNGQQLLVYGTERGVGIIGAASGGGLADMSSQGAWRSVPAGVLSLAASDDGSRILFTSRDGFLQQISTADIIGSEECSGILATKVYSEAAGEDMIPTKVELGAEHAFILSKLSSTVLTTAPTFDQAFEPIFKAMAADTMLSTVSAVNLASGAATEMGLAAKDDSFKKFDRFIPTDISSDGQNLYVVGLAYAQTSVGEYLSTNCTSEEDAADPVECLKNGAKSGALVDFAGSDSVLEKFVAGFFVYRDMADLTKADHFEKVFISLYKDEEAPPFIYAIAGKGDSVYVRGSSFVIAMGREGETAESWIPQAAGGSITTDLIAGIPNRIMPYGSGAVSSFTAVRQSDGSGASALEYSDVAASVFNVLDTGAIFVRVDGAGEETGLVAAIEMASYRGGNLFLENAVTRKPVEPGSMLNPYVSNAAYDGTRLAFAWSALGTSSSPEKNQKWRISVQSGSDSATRGEVLIERGGGTNGEFTGFPALTSDDPTKQRGIGDMAFAEGEYLAILFKGYASQKWYHQVALYKVTKGTDNYNQPAIAGISNTVTSTGKSSAHPGKILGVRKSGSVYEVLFTNATSIYSWKLTPDTSSPGSGTLDAIFGVTDFVDAAMDAKGGSKIAIVSGHKIIIKDADNASAEGQAVSVQTLEGSTLEMLYGARVGLSGSILAIATPYGAAYTFSLYQVGSDSVSLVAGTTLTRFFDVKVFRFFPTYLLASSQASGIEIYDLSN